MGGTAPVKSLDENWIERSELPQLPGKPKLLTSNFDPHLQAQKYQFNGELNQSQQETYQYRRTAHENVVGVYSFEHKYDLSKCVSLFGTFTVVTERVPYRLSMLQVEGVSREQGFYILKNAIRGYNQIYKKSRIFTCIPSGQTIGIRCDGTVKVWINQNWAMNEPRTIRQDYMLNQLINVIEDYVRRSQQSSGSGFGNAFHQQINKRQKSFLEVLNVLPYFDARAKERLANRVKNYAEKRAGARKTHKSESAVTKQRREEQRECSPISAIPIELYSNSRVEQTVRPQHRMRRIVTDRTNQPSLQHYSCSRQNINHTREKSSRSLPENSQHPSTQKRPSGQIVKFTPFNPSSIEFSTTIGQGNSALMEPKNIKAKCMRPRTPSNRVSFNPGSRIITNQSSHLLQNPYKPTSGISFTSSQPSQKAEFSQPWQKVDHGEKKFNKGTNTSTESIARNQTNPLLKRQTESTVSVLTHARTIDITPREWDRKGYILTPVRITASTPEQKVKKNSKNTNFSMKQLKFEDQLYSKKVYFHRNNLISNQKEPLSFKSKRSQAVGQQNSKYQQNSSRQTFESLNRRAESESEHRKTLSHPPELPREDSKRPSAPENGDAAPQTSRVTQNKNSSLESLSGTPPQNELQSTQKFTSMFKFYLQNYSSEQLQKDLETQKALQLGEGMDQQDSEGLNTVLNRREDQIASKGQARKDYLPIIEQGSEFQY